MGFATIDTKNLANNVDVIRNKTNGAIIYAVLKGDAYGLDIKSCPKKLYEIGIRHFAVTDFNDALKLKGEFADCDVLLLTPHYYDIDKDNIIASEITYTVDGLERAQRLSEFAVECNKTVKVHIKIDTGMGRFGFLPSQFDDITKIFDYKNLYVEGIYSHLHSAFNKNANPSLKQFKIFSNLLKRLEQNDINIPIKHICNSAAVFRFPNMHLNAVRCGSAIIGKVAPVCINTGLKPAAKFYGKVVAIRTLPKWHNIGYAGLYKTKKEQKIICVDSGYYHGIGVCKANDTFRFIDILRYVYNDLKLLIKPQKLVCKINGKQTTSLGRIGMTNFVLNGDGIDAKVGDLVEIPVNPLYYRSDLPRTFLD